MYEVDHPEYEATLKRLGCFLKKSLPKGGMDFTLFLFTSEPKSLFYLSSVERDSGWALIQEWAAKKGRKKRAFYDRTDQRKTDVGP